MISFLNQSLLGFIIWLNGFFNDLGISIIIFALILKIVLLPLSFLTFLEELKLQRLRPQINEILKKYKNDFYKQAEILSEVYKKENYNPLFTIFIQFLPLPIFFAIFFVLQNLTKEPSLNLVFLKTIDLNSLNLPLFIILIIAQFLNVFNIPSDQRKIAFFFFGFFAIILINFNALFHLYWLAYLVFSFLERILFKFYQVKFTINSIPKNNS